MEVEPANEPSIWDKLRFNLSYNLITAWRTNDYNQIIPGLVLGAIPIAREDYLAHDGFNIIDFCKKSGACLGKVFSTLEDFELAGKGLFVTPVQPDFWTASGILHELIHVKDFTGDLDLDTLDQAVENIHNIIQENKSVYIHCKAGRGRSVILSLCYMLKYGEFESATTAFEHLVNARPNVAPSGSQFALLESYRAIYTPNKDPLDPNNLTVAAYNGNWLYKFKHSITNYFNPHKLGADTLDEIAKPDFELDAHQKQAFQSGVHAQESWQGWASEFFSADGIYYYPYYCAGKAAVREHREDVISKVTRDNPRHLKVE